MDKSPVSNVLAMAVGAAALAFLLVGSKPVTAQEFMLFETENGAPNSVFGWDIFSGFYPQPHSNSTGTAGGILTASPAGGVISSTANLYSFFSVPTFSIAISGLEDANPFSSIAVQVAMSEVMDATSFAVPPTEFIDLGVRSTLPFEGDVFEIHYYWAQWEGLTAAPAFEFSFEAEEMHVVLAAARVACFNTAQPMHITFGQTVLTGDVNCDGQVNLLDVQPFVAVVVSGAFDEKADINADGLVDLLDVGPFVALLTGS